MEGLIVTLQDAGHGMDDIGDLSPTVVAFRAPQLVIDCLRTPVRWRAELPPIEVQPAAFVERVEHPTGGISPVEKPECEPIFLGESLPLLDEVVSVVVSGEHLDTDIV